MFAEIPVDNLKFEVSVNGDIRQEQKVSSNILDNIRLQASNSFLREAKALTHNQREYWKCVARVTDPKNFVSRR